MRDIKTESVDTQNIKIKFLKHKCAKLEKSKIN